MLYSLLWKKRKGLIIQWSEASFLLKKGWRTSKLPWFDSLFPCFDWTNQGILYRCEPIINIPMASFFCSFYPRGSLKRKFQLWSSRNKDISLVSRLRNEIYWRTFYGSGAGFRLPGRKGCSSGRWKLNEFTHLLIIGKHDWKLVMVTCRCLSENALPQGLWTLLYFIQLMKTLLKTDLE